jgi:hypothetical protein
LKANKLEPGSFKLIYSGGPARQINFMDCPPHFDNHVNHVVLQHGIVMYNCPRAAGASTVRVGSAFDPTRMLITYIAAGNSSVDDYNYDNSR